MGIGVGFCERLLSPGKPGIVTIAWSSCLSVTLGERFFWYVDKRWNNRVTGLGGWGLLVRWKQSTFFFLDWKDWCFPNHWANLCSLTLKTTNIRTVTFFDYNSASWNACGPNSIYSSLIQRTLRAHWWPIVFLPKKSSQFLNSSVEHLTSCRALLDPDAFREMRNALDPKMEGWE